MYAQRRAAQDAYGSDGPEFLDVVNPCINQFCFPLYMYISRLSFLQLERSITLTDSVQDQALLTNLDINNNASLCCLSQAVDFGIDSHWPAKEG